MKPTRLAPCARPGHSAPRLSAVAFAALVAALAAGQARALEIPTGVADLTVRWDNTIRANVAARTEHRDEKIGNSPIADEGTYSFDRGDMVAKRLDLLTELDVVYKNRFGGRLSAAGWYDGAYDDNSQRNPAASPLYTPSYVGLKYSDYIKRLYHGPGGEILDAFVFGRFDLGESPASFKLGRHSLYWGESLFLGGNMNGIAYAQNPLDLQKGFATPGVEAKELFRPLNQLSAQASVTDTLTVAGQYFFEWESFRYPEGGTYLGPVDFAFNGPDGQVVAGLGFVRRGDPSEPKQRGDWGLAARWSPEVLDGTVGFYYRNYSDKLPQTFITNPVAGSARYNLIYADRIDMFGVSLAKSIAGVSVGAELSYRQNTPLNSQVLGVSPGLPESGETKGPRGDTAHGLVNMLGVLPKTAAFDAATWGAELVWAHLVSVSSGANLYNGEGYAPCMANGTSRTRNWDKWDGCATKNFLGLAMAFTPTWYQALPGVDVSLPATYAIGLKGNAPTLFAGNQGNGNYSLGVGVDFFQKYRFDLKYSDYMGRYRDNGSAVTSQNGFTTFLKDRGFIGLTFKTTL
jgi:Protein of unknown function (DUF1302)